MNKLLQTSLGVALACSAFFLSGPTFACRHKLNDYKIERRIQGNWHLQNTLNKDDKHYDVHVSFTSNGKRSGTFESYLNETPQPPQVQEQELEQNQDQEKNSVININGNYVITGGYINATITSSNLPIEGQTKSFHVISLNKNSMVLNDGKNDDFTLIKE